MEFIFERMIGPSKLLLCTSCQKFQKDLSLHVCSTTLYEIERIDNVGVDDDGELLVLIKWVGYEEPTWESYQNLSAESYELLIEWFKINKIEQVIE